MDNVSKGQREYLEDLELACLPEGIRQETDLHAALREADFVTLHVAGTPQTRGMIGAEELACMKPSAVLINVSRGSVVDEKALIAALQNGVIAGAGLDTAVQEPLPPDSPLWTLPNVLITPHTSPAFADKQKNSLAIILGNLQALRNGEKPVNEFTWADVYTH